MEAAPALASVVATSPAVATDRVAYVFTLESPITPTSDDLAVVSDGIETTVVTASAERMTTAQAQGRSVEGPFAVIRLEISLSFGAPGFIAAATSACAVAGVNVFAISTFSYDYLLVPVDDLDAALDGLAVAGFPVIRNTQWTHA